MKRGDLFWAELPPPNGRRPVVVLTRDPAIPLLSAVVVAPVTGTIRGIGSEVPVGPEEGLPEESVVNCDNLYTVRKRRFDADPVATLSRAKTKELDRALRFALELRY